MTLTSAFKKLDKAGFLTEEILPNFFRAHKANAQYVIEFFRNGREDSMTCINVRRFSDQHDNQTDYCAGSFAPNISRAISWATK
jgi:hypothetical protein